MVGSLSAQSAGHQTFLPGPVGSWWGDLDGLIQPYSPCLVLLVIVPFSTAQVLSLNPDLAL